MPSILYLQEKLLLAEDGVLCRIGCKAALASTLLGLLYTGIVGTLAFVAHRHLPFRKILVFNNVLSSVVLLIMVDEGALKMPFTNWTPTILITNLELAKFQNIRAVHGWLR